MVGKHCVESRNPLTDKTAPEMDVEHGAEAVSERGGAIPDAFT